MLDKLLERRRLMTGLITFVFAVLALMLLLELWIVFAYGATVARYLATRVPLLFYLFALWSLRRAVRAIGGPDEEAVARRLGDVGLALFLGGLAQVFFVSWLMRIATGEGGFAYFDVAAITLGAVGFGLLMVARLLEQALRARRELGEFV